MGNYATIYKFIVPLDDEDDENFEDLKDKVW